MKSRPFDWPAFEEACARRNDCAAALDLEGEARAQADMDEMSQAEADRMDRRFRKEYAPIRKLLAGAKAAIRAASNTARA